MHVGLTGEMENSAERWREERGRRPGTWLRRGGSRPRRPGHVGLGHDRPVEAACPDAATTRGDYGVGDEKQMEEIMGLRFAGGL